MNSVYIVSIKTYDIPSANNHCLILFLVMQDLEAQLQGCVWMGGEVQLPLNESFHNGYMCIGNPQLPVPLHL